MNNKNTIDLRGEDENWINKVEGDLSEIEIPKDGDSLMEKKQAYLERILKILNMQDLTQVEGHPVQMVSQNIKENPFFEGFLDVISPEVVGKSETFDLFNFPDDHVARRASDSYYVDEENGFLLRPHTSVMWYHYLINGGGKNILEKDGEIKVMSSGKVYRVDTLDKTHHECFHQIDGLKIIEKNKENITRDTLKDVLSATIKGLFGDNAKYRFNEDQFPYTLESLEVEVDYNGKRLEVLGAGIVHPTVLEKLGIDSDKYSGRAFGFGIERLAMALKGVPDIRLFWSEDPRVIKQWGNFDPYKEVSNLPPVYKDISFVAKKASFNKDEFESNKSGKLELTDEAGLFEIAGIVRRFGGELVEEVKIMDMYENDEKFGEDKKSVSIRICFRSLERTLTDEEINILYFKIRDGLSNVLNYELR